MKFNRLGALSIVLGSLIGTSAVAGQVAAKKDGVNIYSEANKKGSVLGTLAKDQTIEFVERKGMYWQVKTDAGAAGYVSVLEVAKAPETDTNLTKAIRDVVKDGRETDDVAGTRSRSAVMGVRGLGEDDNTRFAGDARPNMRAVYAMEDFRVNKKEVEKLGALVFEELETRMGD